ncbi:MAG: hypothetical protein NTW86_17700 [Candidatus Sumerlaeota bacterium]|nr:hypothetical protein [Candidatus Sumerlaeota bacterium]
MKAKVGEKGVLVPRDLIGDVGEVEIVKEDGRIVVIPVSESADPIEALGEAPIPCGLTDAAEQHDKHLYSAA